MAHKGYTVPYFINFFESIPDHRWTEGELQRSGTVQKCALGHAASDSRAPANSFVTNNDVSSSQRAQALIEVLGGDVAAINDADGSYADLGRTPRGRILRALRNVKRTGNVFGNRE